MNSVISNQTNSAAFRSRGQTIREETQQAKAIYLIVTEQRRIGILPAKQSKLSLVWVLSLCGNEIYKIIPLLRFSSPVQKLGDYNPKIEKCPKSHWFSWRCTNSEQILLFKTEVYHKSIIR